MTYGTVYLAGPITGLQYAGVTDWRDQAKEYLAHHGIIVLSPMRHKEYLLGQTTIKDAYEEHVMSTARGITTRDKFDTQRCDVLLMNLLGAQRVSIGSMIEVGWATGKGTPMVLAMEPENIHEHAMLRELAGFPVLPDLEEALSVVVRLLVP